jgi:hypothetical protein
LSASTTAPCHHFRPRAHVAEGETEEEEEEGKKEDEERTAMAADRQ